MYGWMDGSIEYSRQQVGNNGQILNILNLGQQIIASSQMEEGNNKPQQQHILDYQEFCRLFMINNVLLTQLREIQYDKLELNGKLHRLLKRIEDLGDPTNPNQDKKRRTRRAASEIQRRFKCQSEHCGKSYGTEGSLNHHLKLKHPELYQAFTPSLQNAPSIIDQKFSEGDY